MLCCQVAVLNDGSFLLADGYCNSRVLLYDPDGKVVQQYKLTGQSSTPEMAVPHSVVVDECDHQVVVADRENKAVHVFSLTSGHLQGASLC